jgi:hypothetical protein
MEALLVVEDAVTLLNRRGNIQGWQAFEAAALASESSAERMGIMRARSLYRGCPSEHHRADLFSPVCTM